jgi:hypothetical protein
MSNQRKHPFGIFMIAVAFLGTFASIIILCGCVRTVYAHRDPQSLRVIRMERNGVSGVWMPDAWFSSIRANAACMLGLMHEAEVEAHQKGAP